MTVEELIEELEAMPPTAIVVALVRYNSSESVPFDLHEVFYSHGEVIIAADSADEDDE